MKPLPIIFGAESVRAILLGRKTVTRRVVKHFAHDPGCAALHKFDGKVATFGHSIPDDPVPVEVKCPYPVGRELWVRETWADVNNGPDEYPQIVYRAERATAWHDNHRTSDLHYLPSDWEPRDGRWRSPIHMPRWASRITLDVTGVRCERLQEITERDAEAEGFEPFEPNGVDGFDQTAWMRFRTLWDRVNVKRAPWASNPWVWCVDFRRTKP